MKNILQERRYPQTTIFDIQTETKKFKTDDNHLAMLSEKTQQQHKKILSWGQYVLDKMREDIKIMGMPKKLEFMAGKCHDLRVALQVKREWPTENAIGWIERYIDYMERNPNGNKASKIENIKKNWEVFKNLRELEGYISRGDEAGYRWALEVLKASGSESVQRTAAFFAGE